MVSNVVGNGIFTTTGFLARNLGHPWLILAIWFVGALPALAGALSYSDLGTALPVAGAEYAYLRHAYGPLVGFLSGWTSFTNGFSAATAAGAMSFAAYLLQSVLILSGTFESLVIYSAVVLAIFSAPAVGSVMVLRRRNPELARPYRVPLYPFVPLCYVGLSAAIAVYGFLERPIEAGLGVAAVLAGVPLYVLWTQARGRQRNWH